MDLDFADDDENRIILLVHDTKPPFLSGRAIFSKQADIVLPLKDATSDMAVISRKGSTLVKEMREKKDSNKGRARFWEMAGSKMGAITGLTADEKQVAEVEEAAQQVSGLIDLTLLHFSSTHCA